MENKMREELIRMGKDKDGKGLKRRDKGGVMEGRWKK
jgi:hypothetical protein